MTARNPDGLLFAVVVSLTLLALPACRSEAPSVDQGASLPSADTVRTVNAIAERYVRLVLALGQHDRDYVDAYYGPAEWKKEAEARRRSLPEIRAEANRLIARIETLSPPARGDDLARLRRQYLSRQLRSLASRAEILSGRRMTFDEESRALYDAVAPVESEDRLRELREEISRALPGKAPLAERYEAFRKEFVVSREKLNRVFTAAVDAARARTKAHIPLPDGETFTVEYVSGKSWSAYNWYQGNFKSLIQVNTDLPIFIDRALDLASHEGYPGHHVYNALLEKNLVRGRGWIEYTVYPLFSPQSLIAEGSANFGIEVAFPGGERAEFERKVLFPVAGIDPSKVERYERVRELAEKLSYAGNEAARRYVNREIDAKGAADRLVEYALMTRARAEQHVRFIAQYRSYVINYNLGKDMVRRFIEAKGGTADRPKKRWEEFEKLLSSPRLPSDLTAR
ncbi:MAG TPA: hypothetical protein VER78_05835 [Thermoanaerobaculia bacterium]|nr:hypothetical protein [Thermoanaerobaculia bacterium]